MRLSSVLVIMLFSVNGFAEEASEKKYALLGPNPVVIIPEAYKEWTKYDDTRAILNDFIKEMQWVTPLQYGRSNPECCIWVEYWHYDKPAIFMRSKSSGIHLTIGSTEALKEALGYIKRNMVVKDGIAFFPVGNFVNQPVVDISQELKK